MPEVRVAVGCGALASNERVQTLRVLLNGRRLRYRLDTVGIGYGIDQELRRLGTVPDLGNRYYRIPGTSRAPPCSCVRRTRAR